MIHDLRGLLFSGPHPQFDGSRPLFDLFAIAIRRVARRPQFDGMVPQLDGTPPQFYGEFKDTLPQFDGRLPQFDR